MINESYGKFDINFDEFIVLSKEKTSIDGLAGGITELCFVKNAAKKMRMMQRFVIRAGRA